MSNTIILIYMLIIIGVIIYTGRKVRTYKDFAIAGGKLPWFVVSGTMLATAVGGGTLIGYTGSFYDVGMIWAWMIIGIFVANLIMSFGVVDKIKTLGQFTLPDILNLRYGKNVRMIGALIVFLGEFAVVCAMLSSFASILAGYTSISLNTGLLIGVILFIATASLGGLVGVAYTDAIQAVIIILGVVIVSIITFSKTGGISGYTTLDASMKNIFSSNIPAGMMAGNVISVMCLNFVSQSIFFQRINSCQNPKDAKKAAFAFGVTAFLLTIICLPIMGLGARVLLGKGQNANQIVPLLLQNLPTSFSTLFIAVLVSAVLTTANSYLLSGSMNITRDFYQEFKKNASDKELLFVSKFYIIIAMIIAYFIVRFYPSVIGLILFSYTIEACLIIPLYVGINSKKPTPASGLLAIILGGIATLIWLILKSPFGIHAVFIGIGTSLLGLIIGCYIGPKSTKEQMDIVDKLKKNYTGAKVK